MPADMSPLSLSPESRRTGSPALPTTPMETINTMVHYYRGELGRMAGWRDRIDRTSNWAITVVAAAEAMSSRRFMRRVSRRKVSRDHGRARRRRSMRE